MTLTNGQHMCQRSSNAGLWVKCRRIQAILSQENQVVTNRWDLEFNDQGCTCRHHLDIKCIFIWDIP